RRGHRRHGQDVLRLLVATTATVLLAATGAHAVEDEPRGAGSVFDYEFLAGAGAETAALTTQRADSDGCLLHAPYDEACVDGSACWINDPAAVQDPRKLDGAPRPKRDDHVA